VKLTTHLRLVLRSKSCTSTPPIRLHGVVLRWSTGGFLRISALQTHHSGTYSYLLPYLS
jgi:hypothetical protein